MTAVLAVVEPYSSGLGGGFYLLHRASDGTDVMLDAREKAPQASHRDMYIGSDGEPTRDSLEGPLSADAGNSGGTGTACGGVRKSIA